MKYILVIISLIAASNSFSQGEVDCKSLKSGVFEIHDKGQKILRIYRQNNFQIEYYPEENFLNILKIKSKKCNYYFKRYEIRNDLDTITWIVSYTKNKNFYNYIAKPLYLKIDYKYEGIIKKVSDTIYNRKILNTFLTLKKK